MRKTGQRLVRDTRINLSASIKQRIYFQIRYTVIKKFGGTTTICGEKTRTAYGDAAK